MNPLVKERRAPSLLRSYRRLWWPLKVVVWALPGAGLLAVGYAVLVGDGAEPPAYVGSLVEQLHVCPSAPGVHPVEQWAVAVAAWTGRGWRELEVTADACEGPPTGGVVQVRGEGDLLDGWRARSDHARGTLVRPATPGAIVLQGVLYDRDLDSAGRVHEVGHVYGWMDADRMPSSIMASAGTGMSWDGLAPREAP
jgi:hypothetical protein